MAEIEQVYYMFLTLGVIITYVLCGLHVMSRYFKYQKKIFLYFSIALIGMSQFWMSSFLNKFVLFLDPSSEGISDQLYLLLINVFVPVVVFFYVSAMAELSLFKKYLQWGIIVYFIITSIIVYYLIVVDPAVLIEKDREKVFLQPISLIFSFVQIFFIIGFGFIFSFNGLKADDRETKLKAKFIIVALSMMTIIGVVENLDVPFAVSFVARAGSAIVGVLLYIGFSMPKWVKKLFL